MSRVQCTRTNCRLDIVMLTQVGYTSHMVIGMDQDNKWEVIFHWHIPVLNIYMWDHPPPPLFRCACCGFPLLHGFLQAQISWIHQRDARFDNYTTHNPEKLTRKYSTNHVYLHRLNAFGFWQPRLHLCYETLKRVSNFYELA